MHRNAGSGAPTKPDVESVEGDARDVETRDLVDERVYKFGSAHRVAVSRIPSRDRENKQRVIGLPNRFIKCVETELATCVRIARRKGSICGDSEQTRPRLRGEEAMKILCAARGLRHAIFDRRAERGGLVNHAVHRDLAVLSAALEDRGIRAVSHMGSHS